MSSIVLKAENISKQYRLGQLGTGTISHDVNRWWHKVRGKEDPYLKIGDANDRSARGGSDYVWSLKDINFGINQGEVLGIIGKNGAGKSTLLKILSQITAPTTGEVKIKGRIAALLEVGTGFHPDLSGRENIFLNGAILGMSKHEIKSKLDEIVDFSGVAKYLDTPVKRYSSGMMVRLGFAVAAHLEPEILIVDEVLAVGDAEFQKKCLGKMKDVSGQGRTVLFVSHNMPSIRMLCTKCMHLEKGKVKNIGETDFIIGEYLSGGHHLESSAVGEIPDNLSLHNTGEAKFKTAFVLNEKGENTQELDFLEKFKVSFTLEIKKEVKDVTLSVFIVNQYGDIIMMAVEDELYKPTSFDIGKYEMNVGFNEEIMPGNYSLGFALSYFHTGSDIDYIESFYPFTVNKESKSKNLEYPWATIHGYTKPKTNWQIKKI
ncbi:MAG: ABC transporter ATP-binding protein [Bacteroidota bacterium]